VEAIRICLLALCIPLPENRELYRRRQAIVEHPFGIIKRQWDCYYIMTKRTIKRATADVGLIFTAYKLRRIMNLIGQNGLKKFLRGLAFDFWVVESPFQAICRRVANKTYSTSFLKTKSEVVLESLFLA